MRERQLYSMEEIKMKVNFKHIVEIAGGLIIGALVSDAVDEVVKYSKNMIANHKEKKEEEKES